MDCLFEVFLPVICLLGSYLFVCLSDFVLVVGFNLFLGVVCLHVWFVGRSAGCCF